MRCPPLFAAVLLLTMPAFPQAASQFSRTPPDGAPKDVCTVTPKSNPSTLRIGSGNAPIPFVFSCGPNSVGNCVTQQMQPGSKELPNTAVFQFDHDEAGWSCVAFGSVSGWMPTDRIAPAPSTPAVPNTAWVGWYRNGPDLGHVKSDRLLLTRAGIPGHIHVSGRGYWYGANDNVHFGEVNADAIPFGRYLHVVDGSCVLDLFADPATHKLTANDNQGCGGMNVRFWGTWTRFTPTGHERN